MTDATRRILLATLLVLPVLACSDGDGPEALGEPRFETVFEAGSVGRPGAGRREKRVQFGVEVIVHG